MQNAPLMRGVSFRAGEKSGVVLRGQFVHRLDEGAGMGWIDFRRDAVAQVEHVAIAMTEACQDTRDLGADGVGLGIEHARVHVALQGDLAADPGAGAADVAGPVQAQGLGDAVGFVKVVADAKYNEILGCHMIGPDVTELLPVMNLAKQWDLTADEVSRNVFAHPTLSEAVKEAVEGIAGHMINF